MPKIETPEDFYENQIMLRTGREIVEALAARDAAIRSESAELLRVCGEALKAVCDDLPMNSVRSAVLSRAALAALKDAGCVNKTLKNEQEKNDA